MNWQLITVALIVAAAVLYLGRRSWRTWFARSAGCGGGCGCSESKAPSSAGSLIPSEQLTIRRRQTDPG